MLAEEVFIAQNFRKSGHVGFNRHGKKRHMRQFFDYLGSMGGVGHGRAPAERGVSDSPKLPLFSEDQAQLKRLIITCPVFHSYSLSISWAAITGVIGNRDLENNQRV